MSRVAKVGELATALTNSGRAVPVDVEGAKAEAGTGSSFKTILLAELKVAAGQLGRYAGVGASTNAAAYLLYLLLTRSRAGADGRGDHCIRCRGRGQLRPQPKPDIPQPGRSPHVAAPLCHRLWNGVRRGYRRALCLRELVRISARDRPVGADHRHRLRTFPGSEILGLRRGRRRRDAVRTPGGGARQRGLSHRSLRSTVQPGRKAFLVPREESDHPSRIPPSSGTSASPAHSRDRVRDGLRAARARRPREATS